MSREILIVEDDSVFTDMLATYLRAEGYSVATADCRAAALEHLERHRPDVALIDLGLPDGDGLALASDLGAQSDIGVMIVSGRNDPIDRVVGIEAGADDYISKPPNLRELLARIRAVQRRVAAVRDSAAVAVGDNRAASHASLTFGAFTLDTTVRQIRTVEGDVIHLTTAEYDLLDTLTRRINQAISRDELTQAVFGRTWTPDDRGVDRLVASLRTKLNDNATDPHILITVRGKGYQLAG